MDFKTLFCKKHTKNVTFICCQNEWHCELLCNDCVPDHSISHQKNKTQYNLKPIDLTIQQCSEQLSEMQISYGTKINEIQQFLDIAAIFDDQNLMNLRKWKQQVIELVEKQFNSIEQWYKTIYDELEVRKINNCKNIESDLAEEQQKIFESLHCLSQQIQTSDVIDDEWTNKMLKSIKYCLTKDLQQKLDDNRENFEIQKNQQIEYQFQLNENEIDQIQKSLGKLVDKKEIQKQKLEAQKQENLKKESKTQPKKHLCKECRSEMVYLSDFKKHLACPNCAGVKRNYVSKNISNNKTSQIKKKPF